MNKHIERIVSAAEFLDSRLSAKNNPREELAYFAKTIDHELSLLVDSYKADGFYFADCNRSAVDLAFADFGGSNESFDIAELNNEYGYLEIQ